MQKVVYRCLSILVAMSLTIALTACGGGGGGGTPSPTPTPTPTPTPPAPTPSGFTVYATVSGLVNHTLVLEINGSTDVTVTSNGLKTLATGLATGAAYSVVVKTQPLLKNCVVSNGSGTITNDNVNNIQIMCTTLVMSLNISAPANEALVPVDSVQKINVTFENTTAARLYWEVMPAGLAANTNITLLSSTDTSAEFGFTASVPERYTLRLRSLDDESKPADVNLQVHQSYQAMDFHFGAAFLSETGRIRSFEPGAPSGGARLIAAGFAWVVAIMNDGSAVVWGSNTTTKPNVSALSSLSIKKLAAGLYYGAAIKNDDTLALYGSFNGFAPNFPSSSALLNASTKVLSVDAFIDGYVAVKSNGDLAAWRGDTGFVYTLPSAWSGKKFTQVCATQFHVIALANDGKVYSWNPLGNGSQPELLTVPATAAVAEVYCRSENAALRQTDGRVFIWGGTTVFDSNSISNFPAVKAVAGSPGEPYFLTESGAILDINLNIRRNIDAL